MWRDYAFFKIVAFWRNMLFEKSLKTSITVRNLLTGDSIKNEQNLLLIDSNKSFSTIPNNIKIQNISFVKVSSIFNFIRIESKVVHNEYNIRLASFFFSIMEFLLISPFVETITIRIVCIKDILQTTTYARLKDYKKKLVNSNFWKKFIRFSFSEKISERRVCHTGVRVTFNWKSCLLQIIYLITFLFFLVGSNFSSTSKKSKRAGFSNKRQFLKIRNMIQNSHFNYTRKVY